ncbi:MAG TPA: preprotein translocase subunit SecG [Acidobacteriota bacterium]|nr:preprotein translocase subunit SecG [Acidobacteriota bacterium]
MTFVLVTIHVVACVFLIFVVLLQSAQAADLAGAFGGGGSQTALGMRGATTLLQKATTTAAVIFMVTSLALGMTGRRSVSLIEGLDDSAVTAPASVDPAGETEAPGPAGEAGEPSGAASQDAGEDSATEQGNAGEPQQ